MISTRFLSENQALEGGEYLIYLIKFWDPMAGILTKNSSEKSNAPHMPGVPPPLGLNIDRCITCTVEAPGLPNVSFFSLSFKFMLLLFIHLNNRAAAILLEDSGQEIKERSNIAQLSLILRSLGRSQKFFFSEY